MSAVGRPGYTLGVFDGDILEERIRRLIDRRGTSLQRARMLLAVGLSALAACVVIASGLSLSASAQNTPASEMRLAADAYNGGNFKGAVEHFRAAVNLDPANINARLHLANAILREFMAEPHGINEGAELVAKAKQQYQEVLARDPANQLAVWGLASMSTAAGEWKKARRWCMKLIGLNPKSKGAYYTVGAIDWVESYGAIRDAQRAAAGGAETRGLVLDAGSRKNLRDEFMPEVEEGSRMLQVALQLQPNWSNAMLYMNLLCRVKATLTDSPGEAQALTAQADDWITKSKAAPNGGEGENQDRVR